VLEEGVEHGDRRPPNVGDREEAAEEVLEVELAFVNLRLDRRVEALVELLADLIQRLILAGDARGRRQSPSVAVSRWYVLRERTPGQLNWHRFFILTVTVETTIERMAAAQCDIASTSAPSNCLMRTSAMYSERCWRMRWQMPSEVGAHAISVWHEATLRKSNFGGAIWKSCSTHAMRVSRTIGSAEVRRFGGAEGVEELAQEGLLADLERERRV
jgi:hypothetical protein